MHTTQFAIRDPEHGLYRPVLALVAEEIDRADAARAEPLIRVGGICGPTAQAVLEAETLDDLGYHAGLLSLAGVGPDDDARLAHCRAVAEVIPIIGFYLQRAVGGPDLSYRFWRRFAEIEQVVAIKIAPFDRYRTVDVVRAVCESGRDDIALYTGNDDNIVLDLLTPYRFRVGGRVVERRIVGGLLGHWAVWTRRAVELVESCHVAVQRGDGIAPDLLRLAVTTTDANAAIFDAANGFAGCIAGIHEVLRRQGLPRKTVASDGLSRIRGAGGRGRPRRGRAAPTTARSADLPGFRLPVIASERSAQAPKRVAIVSRSSPPAEVVAAVEEADLVEDAEGGRRRQAVGPQADDDPPFEHRSVGVGGVAEPGVGPRAIGDGDPLAVGSGLGAKLPELGGIEVIAVRDDPIGLAEVAPADRSRRAGGRSAPSRRPRRRGLRGSGGAALASSRAARVSSGISARWVESGSLLMARSVIEPARRAVRGVRAQAGPGLGVGSVPGSSGGSFASHSNAAPLVSIPRSRFRPISSLKTTPRNRRRGDRVPALARRGRVGQQGRAQRHAFGDVPPRRLGRRAVAPPSATGDDPPEPGRPRPRGRRRSRARSGRGRGGYER